MHAQIIPAQVFKTVSQCFKKALRQKKKTKKNRWEPEISFQRPAAIDANTKHHLLFNKERHSKRYDGDDGSTLLFQSL